MDKAFDILGIQDKSNVTWKEIKQKYRLYALKYHPDKNNSEDASIKFLEGKGAYEYLEDNWKNNMDLNADYTQIEETDISNSYTDILQHVLGVLSKNQKINDILERVLSICEEKSIKLLENIEFRKFQMIYSILKKYKQIFSLSDYFYEELEKIKEAHVTNTNVEVIRLKPTIDDLWNHLVYKLVRDNEVYLVPLWHKELIYEHNKKEFIVECILDSSNIWIDADNDIHQEITYDISFVYEKMKKEELIEINYGEKKFTFSPEIIQFKKKQTIGWYEKGISKIMPDIHNISKLSNVFLHLIIN
jgi:hypothetical protein